MPIYETGYRHFKGRFKGHAHRFFTITKRGVALLIKRRRFLFLLILSFIPFLVRGVIIYIATHYPQIRLGELTLNPKFYSDFVFQQVFFVLAIALYTGSGLIANDMRYNALQIYLAKPITRLDYLIGKFGIVSFFLLLVTLVPGLLLFLLRILFSDDLSFLATTYFIPFAILGYSLIMVFFFSSLILALSAVGRSARFAGIGFLAIYFLSDVVFQILRGIFRDSSFALISFQANMSQVGGLFFGLESRYSPPPFTSLAIILLSSALFLLFLHRRVRGVEVVK
jgi:ABC-2 type transport system permease protein